MAIKFSSIQVLGRALMLPIAMLPVAGLLLRFGQPDLLNIRAMVNAGDAIFTNLPLLFAIGVAVGFAKDNHGAAALAGCVGFLIMTAMLKSINKDIDTGVLGGILIGSVAGLMYNKYKDIKLPEFLAFFGGKRFIPIITGLLAVLLAGILGAIWPPIQSGLHSFSLWMSGSGGVGLFLFGFLNRLFLITGLHHIFNSLFWFQLGDFSANGIMVHGDIARFMAGDPKAGYFMAGFFPIMMFGLPALCLAMYKTALPENKKTVAGLLLSMALTSCLTGVTEPIEYSFIFLAPILYLIHAILTGISMALMYYLHIRLGFTFSAGAIDYILFYKLSQNPFPVLLIGIVVFILYFILGVFFIRKFNLQTIGREVQDANNLAQIAEVSANSIEMQYINALGGGSNLLQVDACTTRLRLIVKDSANIDQKMLKTLGAKGILSPSPDTVQIILGPQAEIIASKIRNTLFEKGITPQKGSLVQDSRVNIQSQSLHTNKLITIDIEAMLKALGGKNNLKSIKVVAHTRVRVEIRNIKLYDSDSLKKLEVIDLLVVSPNIYQLYVGEQAATLVANIYCSA